MLDRDPTNWNFHRVLCLTLSKPVKDAALTFEPCASQDQAAIARRRLQQFLVVRGALDGSHPLTTIGGEGITTNDIIPVLYYSIIITIMIIIIMMMMMMMMVVCL